MPQQTAIVTAKSLNVRPEPSTQRDPIGALKRGTRVKVLARHGSWYEIEAGALRGFVFGDFLRLLEASSFAGFLRDAIDWDAVILEADPLVAAPAGADALERAVVRTWNAFGGGLLLLADALEIKPGLATAVLIAESSGRAFGPDGRMIIRFENHVFFREWGRNNETEFRRHFRFDPEKNWLGHEFRRTARGEWKKFHGNQELEWAALDVAKQFHEAAALRSISMGLPQVMGFNHARVGFDSVRAMFDAFGRSAAAQLVGLFDFVRGPGSTSPTLEALQRGRIFEFAALYNGPGQANEYGAKIQAGAAAFARVIPGV